MRKFYSFVLMAAMLLIGANAWAGTYEVSTTQQFENAWAASANEDVVINLNSSNVELQKVMWLGTTNLSDDAHSVVINLNENELVLSGSSYGFLLTHGSLTINGNGTITASCGKELFYITGSNAHATDFTTLKIGQGVSISYSTYLGAISIDALRTSNTAVYSAQPNYKPAKAQLGYNTAIYNNGGKGSAMGVKVEIDGSISAQRYAVKANGDLGYAEADKDYAPYIHIQPHAVISVLATTSEAKKPIALYASGYAKWKIEGTVTGNVGVLAKSGDVDIEGATISSTNTTTYAGTTNSTSGSQAQGSAVVISSEDAYAGEIEVNIGGNSQITGGKGYAVEESVKTEGNNTKVDVITVEGATFTAPTGSQGAVIISAETSTAAVDQQQDVDIQIISAVVDGTLTVTGDQQGTKLEVFTKTSAVIPATSTTPTIIVPLDIKLTSDGFASFSAPINLYKATGKSGYEAFGIYTGVLSNNELQLTAVNFVKAGQGVILYRDPAVSTAHCYFTTTPDNSTDNYGSNDLKASADWASQTKKDRIYCLRNVTGETMLYKYLGANMPDNKAYLDLNAISSNNNNAPARIRMVIAGTQDIENVANEAVKAQKFIENGQVFIKRGERVYNVQGQIVK